MSNNLHQDILNKLKDNLSRMQNKLKNDISILEDDNHPTRARSLGITKTSIKILEGQISAVRAQIIDVEYIIEKAFPQEESTADETTELKELKWQCPECNHENTDLPSETMEPLCGGCDKTFPWQDVPIHAATYFGGDDITVKLSELILISKEYADSGAEMTRSNTPSKPFSIKYDKKCIPAYWGSFGEAVPIIFG